MEPPSPIQSSIGVSIVFVGGPSGCGKSTIGGLLAKRLGFEFIDGDDYHSSDNCAKMASGVPLNDADRLLWLKKLAELGVEAVTRSVLACKGRVIACSALKKAYRVLLIGTLSPLQCRIVMLNVSRSVLQTRIELRKDHFFNINLLDSQLVDLQLPDFVTIKNNNVENQISYLADEEPHVLVVNGDLSQQSIVEAIISNL